MKRIDKYKLTKRRVIKIAEGNDDWRQKYPPCPNCRAIGDKGFTMTRLGNHYSLGGHMVEHNCLHCRSCNSMYVCKQDKDFHIEVGRNLGD